MEKNSISRDFLKIAGASREKNFCSSGEWKTCLIC